MMPVMQMTLREFRGRGQRVSRLMRPLTKAEHGPAWDLRRTQYSIAIGTHDGSPTESNPAEWRFATRVSGLRAAYYEVWTRVGHDRLCLQKAYLNVFRTNRVTNDETKFLSLHCDPNEPNSAPHARYKKGPHLHIQAAQKPFPSAHIALTCGHLDIILSSVESLSDAIGWAVHMLREEVLDEMVE